MTSSARRCSLKIMSPEMSTTDVLIVDASEDCRDVLRTLLERRGVRTNEATEVEQGLEMISQHQPRVIVLDLDHETHDDEQLPVLYQQCAERQDAALVILGRARALGDAYPPERILAKLQRQRTLC